MSIRRIESAYATFLDDEEMSAAEMSVLVALAYVANEKREEDCYPSDRYLKLLTHLGDRTIRSARNSLRSRKIIDWISGGMSRQGGNVSNRYRFLFPYLKMPSQRERYQPLAMTRPTAPAAVPTAPAAVPYGGNRRTLRQEPPTNTEETPKITSEEKPENRGVPRLSDFEFKFDFGVGDKSKNGLGKPETPNREKVSGVDEAMRVCKVKDAENKRTFTSVMLTKNPADCLEEIMAFESEIRQGEHAKAKNLPAILTVRLKALRSQE